MDPRRDPAVARLAPVARRAYPSPTVPAASAAAAPAAAATRTLASAPSESAGVAPGEAPVHKAGKCRLTLERVLGVTALSNAMMSVNPVSGEIAYAAGCIVVIYNLRRNKQVRYYRVDKCVSCLCFSPNGQYLAIGEKGYMPAITIWDGSNGALCAELQLHQFGVACMAFSRDGTSLLSVGLVHDQHVYAWKLTRDDATGRIKPKAVGVAQIQDKVLGVDFCQEGNFFVTVGEKHFKFWQLDNMYSFNTTGMQINDVSELEHRDADMATKMDATFTSVACGYGLCKLKTYAVTSDGTLCCFGAAGAMERLVSLETPSGYAVSVTEAYIAVGGASSVVRLFDPTTLEYRATLPFPPAFGTAGQPSVVDEAAEAPLYPDQPHRYPTTVAVRVSGLHVIALYSDRSIFVYDVSDVQAVRVELSFLFHCGSIRDMKVAGRLRGVSARGKLVYEVDTDGRKIEGGAASRVLPNGAFVTCSDDNTLRIWHLDLHKKPTVATSRFDPSAGNANAFSEAWKNPYSQEMLAVIYHDSDRAFKDEDSIVLGGCCSHENALDIHSPTKDRGPSTGLRAVAIRPDQKHIAVGDSDGNILVAPLPVGSAVMAIGAHNAEVNSIAYAALPTTSDRSDCKFVLVSGGRDRLVQVYDCGKDYTVTSTLENHSGAVTTLKFSSDGSKLLSGGADKTIVFSDVNAVGKVTRVNSVPFSGGKVSDFDITSDHKAVVVASNNRLDMLALSSCKQIKSHHVGEQHHIDVSPGNVCVAVSGSLSDKTIHVIDLESGETLASATGHGEAITSVRFTPDCRRLLSSSNDGCIFVWRLSDDLQSAIKSKLPRIVDPPRPLPVPPKKSSPNMPAAPVLMPPPPPPPPLPVPKELSMGAAPPPIAESKLATSGASAPLAKGSKKKQTEDVSRVVSSTAAMSVGNSEPKQNPADWRGKMAAVPGPMSNIPMEDWMRTRESAKKPVAVVDEASSLQVTGTEAVLVIDRSETPDWAKTAAPTRQETKTKEVQTNQKPPAPQAARGKWGELGPAPILQSAADALGLDGTAETSLQFSHRAACEKLLPADAVIEGDVADPSLHEESDSIDGEEANQLLNLSVDDLVLSPCSSLRASTSLALEREQLEKRQKQIDTANAVAAMNMKLSQLGLLKAGLRPGGRRPSASMARGDGFEQGSPNLKRVSTAVSSTVTPQIPSASAGIPDSIEDSDSEDDPDDNDDDYHKSIEYDSSSSASSSSSSSNTDNDRYSIDGGDTKDPLPVQDDVTLEEHTSEVSYMRPDIPPEMLESIDLPAFSRDILLGVSSVATTVATKAISPVRQPAVDQSLSAFTQGFTVDSARETPIETDNAGHDHPDHISVDCSLSAFSSGYAGASTTPRQSHQSPTPAVMVSLSSFTAGYEAHALNNKRDDANSLDKNADVEGPASTSVSPSARVDCSISAFTSGYATEETTVGAMSSISGRAAPLFDVAQSTSAFTSGYAAAVSDAGDNEPSRSADTKVVAASLSSFTAGYESGGPRDAPEDVTSNDSSAGLAITPLLTMSNGVPKSTELRHSYDAEGHDDIKNSRALPTSECTKQTTHPDVMQSLSSFTTGYESLAGATATACSDSASASTIAGEKKRLPSTEHPPAFTVTSTISALDEQLRAASLMLEDLPAADLPAKGAELERIQHLVEELRAAIRRLDAS